MGDIRDKSGSGHIEIVPVRNDLVNREEEMLLTINRDLSDSKVFKMPIGELSTLGAAIASLDPAFRTITQTTTVNVDGLYRLANASVGDVLKEAKNGNFWGSLKTVENRSKMLQLKSAEPLSVSGEMLMPVNPAMVMMAVALFSIEQKLEKIIDMQEEILSFLEVEKESEMEADIETLVTIANNYKLSWDNKNFITSNHKLALDIQRTSRKNMKFYKKKIEVYLSSKQLISSEKNNKSKFLELDKKVKYYRLSLYIFSLSSLLEVMLSGNFMEDYVHNVKLEIEKLSHEYRELFGKCSFYLEKIGSVGIETNMAKGLGIATENIGKFIGSIPLIREGQVDEFLQDSGSNIKGTAKKLNEKYVLEFAKVSNPETGVFVEHLENIIQIYNHTSGIKFDNKEIYLLASKQN